MNSEAITDGVLVKVISNYQAEASDPGKNQYIFSYTVTIENRNDYSIRLLSRYWEIKDGMGAKRIVEGDGVVGKQPIIPSSKNHEYSSWCPLATTIGCMRGHYVMQRSHDNSVFKVAIPLFTMQEKCSSN